MSLLKTYEEFTNINKEFISFIDKLVMDNFKTISEEIVKMNLDIALKNYEDLKFESDRITVDNNNINNLNELRYLIMNALFLVSDLKHFYEIKEFDRFRMRAVNYINTSRRTRS